MTPRAPQEKSKIKTRCSQAGSFGVTFPHTYSQYEIGVLNYPLDVVIRLAQFYGTSTDYLLGLTDTPDPYPRRRR